MNKPNNQKFQEKQYDLPYHWFFKIKNEDGRKYFGYINQALNLAKKFGLNAHSASILDAGCGDARFIQFLYDKGYHQNVHGIDYSDSALRFAKVFLPKTKFFTGDLTKFETLQTTHQYDAIFLIETLEHIPVNEVDAVLSNLYKLLVPGGLLIITVPSKRLVMHKKHFQHFTELSLRTYTEKVFKVELISGYDLDTKFGRLLYKMFDNRIYTIKPGKFFFNKILYQKFFASCDPFSGKGLIAVCRKT